MELVDEKKIKRAGLKETPQATVSGELPDRGSWRTFKPVIDYTRCIKCYMCWLNCPDSAYDIGKDEFPHCNSKTCKGCLICREVCPVKCITGQREKRE